MTRASLAGWTVASGFLLLAVVSGRAVLRDGAETLPGPSDPSPFIEQVPNAGLLYGRVTTTDGDVHQGRLRFGGDEEALWTHYFNGTKAANPWADRAPESALVRDRPRRIAGLELGSTEGRIDLERPFMVRFGDIARIDAERRTLSVTLRSGDVVTLARFEADDFADGVRVWEEGGVTDLDEWSIRSIEFLPTPAEMTGPAPLRGTVRTSAGEFAGLLQWDREEALVTDLLEGRDEEGLAASIPFGTIRSISRVSGDALRAELLDGDAIGLTDIGEALPHRGIYVDDPRYGRVLVSWDAVEEVTFALGVERGRVGEAPGDEGVQAVPGFESFDGGAPLRGTVTTRSGERFTGRLVHDLDESRTIETLDAPWFGVDYMLPMGRIASIELVPPAPDGRATALVTLEAGEILRLEAEGDLGPDVPGLLILPEADGSSEFIPWSEVKRVDFDHGATPSTTPGR